VLAADVDVIPISWMLKESKDRALPNGLTLLVVGQVLDTHHDPIKQKRKMRQDVEIVTIRCEIHCGLTSS
jgi:hypothetical protein